MFSFLDSRKDWIQEQVQAHPPAEKLISGASLSFRGRDYQLDFTDTPPRRVALDGDTLRIGGPADMAPKRLLSWMKKEARATIQPQAEQLADQLGKPVGKIGIGDQRSRWGSCSARGSLRFNWRLIMAPDPVLTYVVAHEVSHLKELNHSPRFWAHVESLMPGYKEPQAWLKKHGGGLLGLGFD